MGEFQRLSMYHVYCDQQTQAIISVVPAVPFADWLLRAGTPEVKHIYFLSRDRFHPEIKQFADYKSSWDLVREDNVSNKQNEYVRCQLVTPYYSYIEKLIYIAMGASLSTSFSQLCWKDQSFSGL